MVDIQEALDAPELAEGTPEGSPSDGSVRRFVWAITVGMVVVAVPYLFVLWNLWTGSFNPFRAVGPSNFYEIQAQSLVRGHLDVAPGKLGVEAFIHGGHAYTYFGIFPSILRMPVMAILPPLDGHMTAPSLLLAWLVTGVFASMLLWRVRILARGRIVMGWAEAVSCGVLVAAITGGSVLVYLAANPWVYDEDLAWSVALMTGSLFALLGIMEKPSRRRVTGAGLLILAASLNRLTTGWACIIAALLVAGWLALGRGGAEKRRWTLPVLAAGLVPLLVEATVNWAKFGAPFTLPLAEQVWTQINAHRRHFLAVNGGRGFSLRFLPSTVVAYLKPSGLRLSSIFPFITLPDTPPQIVGNVVLDQTYSTASVPASMPLLFLLSVWGLVTAFRPRAVGLLRFTRVLLVGAAAATAGVLLWGYIADRYLADFMPILILASVIGLVDLWRRVGNRSRRLRGFLMAALAIFAAFSVVANVGAAMESMNVWTSGQAVRFVEAQKALSLGSLASTVDRGPTLPYWAPTGQIFDVNSCSGLYLSSGTTFRYSPGQQLQHESWVPLEQATGINHTIGITLNKPAIEFERPIPILTYGPTTVILEPAGARTFRIVIDHPGRAPSWPTAISPPFIVQLHKSNLLSIMTDPHLHSIQVRNLEVNHLGGGVATLKPGVGQGSLLVDHYLAGTGPAVVLPGYHPSTLGPPVTVRMIPTPPSTMSLCRSLRRSAA